jgi:CBS domain containing-hemolysin-like protein
MMILLDALSAAYSLGGWLGAALFLLIVLAGLLFALTTLTVALYATVKQSSEANKRSRRKKLVLLSRRQRHCSGTLSLMSAR